MKNKNFNITDFTDLLNNKDYKNYYCFNNSLIHYKDNLFLMSYRVIYSNCDQKYHPWKMWYDGDKLFYNLNTDKFSYNIFNCKYRNINNNYIIKKASSFNNIDLQQKYFDSTGLAVLKYENETFSIVYNMNNIFDNDMNQDARICKIDSDFYITYNGYINKNSNNNATMLYRKISFLADVLFLSTEKHMCDNIGGDIEKNWVFHDQTSILYKINGSFQIIENNVLKTINVLLLKQLIDFYGDDNIYISLSTPPVNYNGKYLSVGHIKIAYKNINKESPFIKFLNNTRVKYDDLIKNHGKYIYFMFFFEYTSDFIMTRISHSFIPTNDDNCHLPYLLVFASGLTIYENKLMISYGEGDVRSKLLTIDISLVNNMLVDVDDLTPETYKFSVIKNINKNRILILGYYNKLNTGDDLFKYIFTKLNIPNTKSIILNINDINKENNKKFLNKKYNLIICGGGDIFNDYFMDNMVELSNKIKTKYICFSTGISYESYILNNKDKLKIFDSFFIRNKNDVKILSTINQKTHYIPDMVHAIYEIPLKPINALSNLISKNKINIGVFLSMTVYNVKYHDKFINILNKLSSVFNHILSTYSNIKFILIPFCIDNSNAKENDMLINKYLKNISLNTDIVDVSDYYNLTEDNHVDFILNIYKHIHIGICTRFHSHVLSVANNIPFVSLSSTRKCSEYMKDLNIEENLCKFETSNDTYTPIDFDNVSLQNMLLKTIKNIKSVNKIKYKIKYNIDITLDSIKKILINYCD